MIYSWVQYWNTVYATFNYCICFIDNIDIDNLDGIFILKHIIMTFYTIFISDQVNKATATSDHRGAVQTHNLYFSFFWAFYKQCNWEYTDSAIGFLQPASSFLWSKIGIKLSNCSENFILLGISGRRGQNLVLHKQRESIIIQWWFGKYLQWTSVVREQMLLIMTQGQNKTLPDQK